MDESRVPFQTIEAFLAVLDAEVAHQRLQAVLAKLHYLLPDALDALYAGEHDLIVSAYGLERISPLRRSRSAGFRSTAVREAALSHARKQFYDALERLLHEHIRRDLDADNAREALELLRNPPAGLAECFGL